MSKTYLDVTDVDFGNNICDIAATIDSIRENGEEVQMIPYGDESREGLVIPLSTFDEFDFPTSEADCEKICEALIDDLDWITHEKNDAWQQMQNPGDDDYSEDECDLGALLGPYAPDDNGEPEEELPPRIWIANGYMYVVL